MISDIIAEEKVLKLVLNLNLVVVRLCIHNDLSEPHFLICKMGL